jgi:hypothetical protein
LALIREHCYGRAGKPGARIVLIAVRWIAVLAKRALDEHGSL